MKDIMTYQRKDLLSILLGVASVSFIVWIGFTLSP